MAEDTSIEWCDSTFNPWIGCTRVSPACDHCYAARSTPARTLGVAWGPGQPRLRTGGGTWAQPKRWNAKRFMQCADCGWRGEASAPVIGCGRCGSIELDDARRRVFCASLADVFDNEVDPQWRIDLLELIAACPNIDWLLLTKRIGNTERMLDEALDVMSHGLTRWRDAPWPNVWLGSTICNQIEADRDIQKLLQVPARVRFLSIEPMLGPIMLHGRDDGGTRWIGGQRGCGGTHRHGGDPAGHDHGPGTGLVVCDPRHEHHHHDSRCKRGIDWVICGGESGTGARSMHPDWARSLRDQCAAAGVPFMFKQWGEHLPVETERTADGISVAYALDGCGELPERSMHVVEFIGQEFARVGKKAAGRLLDGRAHDSFPSVAHIQSQKEASWQKP